MKKFYGSIDTLKSSSHESSLDDLLGNVNTNHHDVIDETENLISRIDLPREKGTIIDDADASIPSCRTSYLRNFRLIIGISAFLCGTSALAMYGLNIFLPTNENLDYEHSFQYIIVGAGPAGLVVGINIAKRLQQEAEITNTVPGKVLILESGTESQSDVMNDLHILSGTRRGLRPPFVAKSDAWSLAGLNKFDIPLMWSRLSSKADESEYLSHHWPVTQSFLGRSVGGSGLHNAMINVRALPNDFDKWNVTNWSADQLMPYYSMLEDYDDTIPAPNVWSPLPSGKNRGTGGPLKIKIGGESISPIVNDFILSSLAAGFPLASPGFNEAEVEKRLGVGYYEFNIRDGIRDSVAKALLSPEIGTAPSNLIVKTDATVKEVLFETMGGTSSMPKAVGVRYYSSSTQSFQDVHLLSNKAKRHAHLKRKAEVILSAGAILSSQILANSGISKNGKLVDSPEVGSNVQDHPAVAVVYQASQQLSESIRAYFNADNDQSISFENYLDVEEKAHRHSVGNETMSAHSLVYGSAGISVGGFLASPWSKDNIPDIQLTVFPHTMEPHFIHRNRSNDIPSAASPAEDPEKTSVLITAALLSPESRNSINLSNPNSNDPESNEDSSQYFFESYYKFQVPIIEGGDLTELDTKRLAWGVEQVRNIMSQPPLSKHIEMEQYPGVEYKDMDLQYFIQTNALRNSHWSGSTRMGDDKEAVVDPELRVNGVDNLRVVDAGIMPFIPNGNTHGTTCVIALRAVDLIFTKT